MCLSNGLFDFVNGMWIVDINHNTRRCLMPEVNIALLPNVIYMLADPGMIGTREGPGITRGVSPHTNGYVYNDVGNNWINGVGYRVHAVGRGIDNDYRCHITIPGEKGAMVQTGRMPSRCSGTSISLEQAVGGNLHFHYNLMGTEMNSVRQYGGANPLEVSRTHHSNYDSIDAGTRARLLEIAENFREQVGLATRFGRRG